MDKIYSRILWENLPSTATPLNSQNLNAMDAAIDGLDDRIIEVESQKVSLSIYNQAMADLELQLQQLDARVTALEEAQQGG